MALRLEDKKALVKEVNAVAGDSVTAVAAEYRGLSVAEMTELRKEARNAGVYMRVVKNTLARRAVEGTEFECMQETLKGPILLAFAKTIQVPLPGLSRTLPRSTTLCRRCRYQPAGNCCPGLISRSWQICRRWIRRAQCCSASW